MMSDTTTMKVIAGPQTKASNVLSLPHNCKGSRSEWGGTASTAVANNITHLLFPRIKFYPPQKGAIS
jgi:hypothetical protein